MLDTEFFKNKRVFITGHTGFKGSWLCKMLEMMGAAICGYSLGLPTEPALFPLCHIDMQSVTGDIRNYEALSKAIADFKPDVVLHLAAQPIVRDSYKDPRYTYETNVMGTVNLLESIRSCENIGSVVNITTDKVYRNNEWEWGYRENDRLDGFEPYSNSKSCSELVTACYTRSFFKGMGLPVSTCRAGNVIGGGDFATDRIMPDCARAASEGRSIIVRNPYSVRPYQHVLEPLYVYLMIAEKQYKDISTAGNYNVGPDDSGCVSTGELADMFCSMWDGASWQNKGDDGPHEAGLLKLDCSHLKSVFGWEPGWKIEKAVEKTVEWFKIYYGGGDISVCMKEQINEYLNMKKGEANA